jgi:hypothetical protein
MGDHDSYSDRSALESDILSWRHFGDRDDKIFHQLV